MKLKTATLIAFIASLVLLIVRIIFHFAYDYRNPNQLLRYISEGTAYFQFAAFLFFLIMLYRQLSKQDK